MERRGSSLLGLIVCGLLFKADFGAGLIFPWPSRPDSKRVECQIDIKDRIPVSGSLESYCHRNKGCWDSRAEIKCYKPKDIDYPRTCQESYAKGNSKSGIHELASSTGRKFKVYCYFVNSKAGYVFPDRDAVANFGDLVVSDLSSENDNVLVLQKHTDGTTTEALLKQLKVHSEIGLTFYNTKYERFVPPFQSRVFGAHYIYIGFLDKETYQQKKQNPLGFISNDQNILYKDCDNTPNNYFAFYVNPMNRNFCEQGWTMGRSLLNSFKPSALSAVMDSSDFWFTMESHFGGCGMRYSSAGCTGIKGYAVGLPFEMKSATCWCTGALHCYSFDNKHLSFRGTCQYTMVQDGCANGVYNGASTFRVIADFHRKKYQHFTIIKSIHVDIVGKARISLLEGNKVMIDAIELRHFPAQPLPGIYIRKFCSAVTITMETGVEITWSSHRRTVDVKVPSNLQNQVCGLCGNFNGRTADDFIMGEYTCPNFNNLEGTMTSNENLFGVSWQAASDNDAGCAEECKNINSTIPACSLASKIRAKIHCYKLFNPLGRFQKCLAKMTVHQRLEILEDCGYDVCISGGAGKNSLLCAQAETLVKVCQDNFDVHVTNWRDKTFCPMTCPANMVYLNCGPSCHPSCFDLQVGSCSGPCVEGCFCKPGFVFDGDACIRPDDCGCEMDGMRYEVGESILSADCSQTCKCIQGKREMVCSKSNCDPNALCTVQNKERVCVCPPNYITKDNRCIPVSGYCKCQGDPHCTTFDNKRFDYMGSCQYTMVQDGCVDGVSQQEPSVRIVADFIRRNPVKRITWTKALYIYTTGKPMISLIGGKVMIGGVRLNHFPAKLSNGLKIYKTCISTYVLLPNGLKITYHFLYSKFEIFAPGRMQNTLCGLCGNFNVDPSDDMILGSGEKGRCPTNEDEGKVSQNVDRWGMSWVDFEDDDAGCKDECENPIEPPPNCPPTKQQIVADHCAELFNKDGRFKECLMFIDNKKLKDLVRDCEFDACMVDDDDLETLCSSAEDLAVMCLNDYDIKISDWRDENFCPLPCPENSKYKSCGSACPATCSEEEGTDCGPCVEGCFCVDGYVADGSSCITKGQCGCTMDGIWYQLGESVLMPGCSKRCTCPRGGAEMVCVDSDCDENSVCVTEDDTRVCICSPPFVGDGTDCVLMTPEPPTPVDPPCNALPSNCVMTSRGKCMEVKENQRCGVGVMTEHRKCYKNNTHTGPFTSSVINRKCCIEKCKPNGPFPDGPNPNDITCRKVYPYCE